MDVTYAMNFAKTTVAGCITATRQFLSIALDRELANLAKVDAKTIDAFIRQAKAGSPPS
jgi:hypothetical protein